jgi:hypothetical protein
LSFPKRGETVLRRHLPFHNAGHLVWGGRESAEFRGDTDQETNDTALEQIPLREAYAQEQPCGNVEMYQSPACERYPTEIVGDSSHQLQSSEVAHGNTLRFVEVTKKPQERCNRKAGGILHPALA